MYTTTLLKIGKIAGMWYNADVPSETLVVYGIGAPIPPDNGRLPDAKVMWHFDTDIFVPDYIGFGRSDGVFTPKNCVKTFTMLFDAFTKGTVGKNFYSNKEYMLKYKRIIFIGRSLGGTYVPLLPKFNAKITELAIFCPDTDSTKAGSVVGEETNEDFLRSMRHDGYKYLYRGVLSKVWEKQLNTSTSLSPLKNILALKNAKLFIAHGKKDVCIHYSKSEMYYEEIMKQFPNKKDQFVLKLYENGGHNPATTNPATKYFLSWLRVKKRK